MKIARILCECLKKCKCKVIDPLRLSKLEE